MRPGVVHQEDHVVEVLSISVQIFQQVPDEFEEVDSFDRRLLDHREKELRAVMGDDAVELCLPRIGQSICLFALFTPGIVLDTSIVDGKLVDGNHPLVRVKSKQKEPTPDDLVFDVLITKDLVASD